MAAGSGGEPAERTDDIAAKHVCDDVLAYLFSVSRILKVNARKDTGINQHQLSEPANMPSQVTCNGQSNCGTAHALATKP